MACKLYIGHLDMETRIWVVRPIYVYKYEDNILKWHSTTRFCNFNYVTMHIVEYLLTSTKTVNLLKLLLHI